MSKVVAGARQVTSMLPTTLLAGRPLLHEPSATGASKVSAGPSHLSNRSPAHFPRRCRRVLPLLHLRDHLPSRLLPRSGNCLHTVTPSLVPQHCGKVQLCCRIDSVLVFQYADRKTLSAPARHRVVICMLHCNTPNSAARLTSNTKHWRNCFWPVVLPASWLFSGKHF